MVVGVNGLTGILMGRATMDTTILGTTEEATQATMEGIVYYRLQFRCQPQNVLKHVLPLCYLYIRTWPPTVIYISFWFSR